MGVFCTDFRVYSGVYVRVVGVQLTKYSLEVMRAVRQDMESLATDRKTL